MIAVDEAVIYKLVSVKFCLLAVVESPVVELAEVVVLGSVGAEYSTVDLHL